MITADLRDTKMINKAHICCKCGKIFHSHIVTVTEKSKKNKRGRIAWERDAVCVNCQKEEKNAVLKMGEWIKASERFNEESEVENVI